MMNTLFTIGYEGGSIGSFVEALKKYHIDKIVDIREYPLSRKPGFSKKALSSHLESSGIDYIHMVELGCPKAVRDEHKKSGDWRHYTEQFAEYLQSQDSSIAELAVLAENSACALLCFEADHNYCHRTIVAKAVSDSTGIQIVHIQALKHRGFAGV